MNRLIQYTVGSLAGSTVAAPSTLTSYQLDPVGNWSSKTTNGVMQTRVYDAVNQLTTIDGSALAYDANGNLQSDAAYAYTFDEENRMTEVTRNADLAVVAQYEYDAFGRRVQKIANPGGTPAATVYFYDGVRVIEEQNAQGATAGTYVYGNYIDEVLTMDRQGQTYYYHQNAAWSVDTVTDGGGNPVEHYAYDAYGAVTVTDGSGAPVAANPWGAPHSARSRQSADVFTGRQVRRRDRPILLPGAILRRRDGEVPVQRSVAGTAVGLRIRGEQSGHDDGPAGAVHGERRSRDRVGFWLFPHRYELDLHGELRDLPEQCRYYRANVWDSAVKPGTSRESDLASTRPAMWIRAGGAAPRQMDRKARSASSICN